MRNLKIEKKDGKLELTVKSKKYSEDQILKKLKRMLSEGSYFVDIYQIEKPESLQQIKKKYFAMVQQLASHAGYLSNDDRELFKEQVKQQLGNRSIAEMSTMIEVEGLIEDLVKLASDHFWYIYPPDHIED